MVCAHKHGLTYELIQSYAILIPCVRKTVPYKRKTLVQFDKMVTSATAGEWQQQQIVAFPFPVLLTTNPDQSEMVHGR